jgi:hypothetical protein
MTGSFKRDIGWNNFGLLRIGNHPSIREANNAVGVFQQPLIMR